MHVEMVHVCPTLKFGTGHNFPFSEKDHGLANSGDQAYTKWRLAETTETAPLNISICSADPNSWMQP